MTTKFLRSEVQTAIEAAAKDPTVGKFYAVSYDTATQVPIVDTATVKAPSGVSANEISATWGQALNRRSVKRDRASWRWQLVLEFDSEVMLEAFELAITDKPIRVVRDPANGLTQQATARLSGSDVRHPPRQSPNGGSRVIYDFDVEVTPL